MDADATCLICSEPLFYSGAHIIVNYRTEDSWQGIHADCQESGEDEADAPTPQGSETGA